MNAASGTASLDTLSGTGTLSAAGEAVLDLLVGATLAEKIGGADTLELNSASAFTLAGGTLGVETVQIAVSMFSGYGTVGARCSMRARWARWPRGPTPRSIFLAAPHSRRRPAAAP